MNERTTKTAIDEAVVHYEQLFGAPAQVSTLAADADFSMMERACSGPPSDAFESAHVFDILQSVRRMLLRAGQTIYDLCN